MPNGKTDNRGFSTKNADEERDIGSKGGPAVGVGNPTGRHGISAPYNEDLQTQIAAKGRKKRTDVDHPSVKKETGK